MLGSTNKKEGKLDSMNPQRLLILVALIITLLIYPEQCLPEQQQQDTSDSQQHISPSIMETSSSIIYTSNLLSNSSNNSIQCFTSNGIVTLNNCSSPNNFCCYTNPSNYTGAFCCNTTMNTLCYTNNTNSLTQITNCSYYGKCCCPPDANHTLGYCCTCGTSYCSNPYPINNFACSQNQGCCCPFSFQGVFGPQQCCDCKKLIWWAILLIVVGALLFLAFIGIVIYRCCRKKVGQQAQFTLDMSERKQGFFQ